MTRETMQIGLMAFTMAYKICQNEEDNATCTGMIEGIKTVLDEKLTEPEVHELMAMTLIAIDNEKDEWEKNRLLGVKLVLRDILQLPCEN